MKFKRLSALGLAAAMFLCTTGMTTYAEEEVVIEITQDGNTIDGEVINEESGSIADDSTNDAGIDEAGISDVIEDKPAADEDTDHSEEADGLIEADEEKLEADGIEAESDDSAVNDKESWMTLITKENGVSRQVIIFAKEDGSWTDDKGNPFTQNEDGSWTDANGVVYHKMDESTDSSLIESMETAAEKEKKEDSSGSTPADFMMNTSKKIVQSSVILVIDTMMKSNPNLIYPLGALKTLIGEVFGLNNSKDSNQDILDKLEEIDGHLDRMENSLKEHMENVAAFDSIGGEFQKVTNATSPLEDKIGDVNGLYKSGKINEEEKNSRLAALYNSSEYNSLMQALSGATNAYGGKTSYTLDQRSIFGAAYNLQCNSVMFSGEAVDCVAPYLMRQLCIYLRGYALINTVLDAYELVNGTDATMRTRNTMFKNLGGVVNGKVDKKNPGVFGLYSEFFNTNRYIFVNKSSNKANHVKLDKTITALLGMAEANLGNGGAIFNTEELKNRTPQVMSRFPLNAEQMKNLAAYCAAKKLTLIDFLLNNVGFELKIPYTPALSRLVTEHEVAHGVTPQTVISGSGSGTLLEYLKKGDTFVPTGAQNYTYESGQYFGYSFCEPPRYNYMQAVRANKVGAGDEKVTVASNLDKKRTGKAVNANLLFFYKAK